MLQWEKIVVGVAIIGVSLAVAATAGLVILHLSLIGAATFGEILVGRSALAFAGAGGFAAGTGVNSTKGTSTVTNAGVTVRVERSVKESPVVQLPVSA